jgi:lipopolysaccharide exporter
MSNLIQSLRDFFLKGGFLSNVLVLVGGTAFSQVLLFLALPLVTRLYKPDDFGAWAVIKSLGSIFSVVACLRYELAIVIPKQDRDAANLFAGSVLIATVMSGLLLLIVSFFGTQVAQLLADEAILPWLWVLPLTLLLTGIYQSSNYWSTRKGHFKRLSISRIAQSIVMIGMWLGLPFIIGVSSSNLIMGALFGQIAATGSLAIQILIEDGNFLIKSLSWKSIKDGIYNNKNFPLYVTPYSFIGNLQNQVVLMLLATFTTTKIVGFYSFTSSIVMMPIGLIVSSLNQVFFPKASQQLESGDLGKFVTKVLTSLVVIATPIFAFFIFNIEWIFTIFFGDKWTEASTYGFWLGLMAFMMLFTSWLDRIYDVLGKQRMAMLMAIGISVLSISCFGITLGYLQKPVLAVAIYSLLIIICEYLWLVVTFELAKFPRSGIWNASKFFVSIFASCFLVNWVGRNIFDPNLSKIFEGILVILYYAYIGWNYYTKPNKDQII